MPAFFQAYKQPHLSSTSLMRESQFTPKLFSLLREGITRERLTKDLIAGLIVGIVALPLAIAFAIASGVPPDKGLVTAIVAGIVISALGGSRVQIGGPTGAFIVIVYAIVQKHGVGGLTIATFMAGFILIAMGLARFGNLLKYIPHSLIIGFTSGIALIIFSSQVKDFLGLPIGAIPADFVGKWQVYALHIKETNWTAFAIALGTVVVSFNFHRVTTKVPGSIVAIILSTLLVQVWNLPVTTIATTFGDIPNRLALPAIPHIDLATVKELVQPALAIALLGGIESLLSAVVADGMIGGRHRSNAELVGQGLANCASAMFGGIPATGAVARTATNVKNGGRTPIAGIVHSLVLLLVMLFLAPYARHIPMAALAGILVVVAYHMSEWRQFRSLLKGNKSDILILLTTFFLTVVFDLVMAIELGIVLSSFLLIRKMSCFLSIQSKEGPGPDGEILFEEELPALPKGVAIYEIHGALFFGVAQFFQDAMDNLQDKPKVLILRMRHVPFIDATGTYRLKEVIKRFTAQKVKIILSGVNENVMEELIKADIHSVLGKGNLLGHISGSLERAKEVLQEE